MSDERERILVVRFSSLGDILLTAPALRALRRRFPAAEICLLVAREYADAASLIPGLDQILTFDRNTGLSGLWKLRAALSGRFSILVDLQNSLRSAFLRHFTLPVIWTKANRYRFNRWLLVHFKWNRYGEVVPVPIRYLRALDLLGVDDDDRGLELRVPDAARASTDRLFEQFHGRLVVALCPGARHFTKRWPKDYWIELGRRQRAEGFEIVVFGDETEQELANSISGAIPSAVALVGRPITEVAAVMQRCEVVASNDSGLMHLAGGIGTPVVGIFGPTVKEFGFFPFRARSEVVEQNLNCRPCSAMGTELCREKHFRCMLDTTPIMVADAMRRVGNIGKQES